MIKKEIYKKSQFNSISQVQVIPWAPTDSNHVKQPSQRVDSNKTIFVGALHGMITAETLANIMNDLFGYVVYAGIDTDKYKYPIGQLDIIKYTDVFGRYGDMEICRHVVYAGIDTDKYKYPIGQFDIIKYTDVFDTHRDI